MVRRWSQKSIVAIVVAFIGLAGIIVTSIIGPIVTSRALATTTLIPSLTFTSVPILTKTKTPISTSVVIENIASPMSPTFTATYTSTPTPTLTFTPTFTFTPTPYFPGDDWLYGCVSTKWKIYPNSVTTVINSDNCYQEPIVLTGSYFVSGQQLSMLMSAPIRSAETFGLFTQLPSSGQVELTVDLDELENGEIWVGIFSKPDPNSSGLMLLIPPGNIKNSVFSLREMPSGFQKYITGPYYTDYGIYKLRFFFSAGSLSFGVNFRNYTEQYPLAFSEKWLFIGYRAKTGNNDIEASFSDLIISQVDE